jgi:hypothetical protein
LERQLKAARGGYNSADRYPWIVEAALKNRKHPAYRRVQDQF